MYLGVSDFGWVYQCQNAMSFGRQVHIGDSWVVVGSDVRAGCGQRVLSSLCIATRVVPESKFNKHERL